MQAKDVGAATSQQSVEGGATILVTSADLKKFSLNERQVRLHSSAAVTGYCTWEFYTAHIQHRALAESSLVLWNEVFDSDIQEPQFWLVESSTLQVSKGWAACWGG